MAEDDVRYVVVEKDGELVGARDDRQPSLYTGDFGECMESSSFTVTRFDAAFYKDNMTVLFHLGGETSLRNESIMSTKVCIPSVLADYTDDFIVYIGVFAYGEARFDLTFNPCDANIRRYDHLPHQRSAADTK